MVDLFLRPNFDFAENHDKAALISDFERIKAALSRIDTSVESLASEASVAPLAAVQQPLVAMAEDMVIGSGTSYNAPVVLPGFGGGKFLAVGPSFSGPVWESLTVTSYTRSGTNTISHATRATHDGSGTLHTVTALLYGHLPSNFTGWGTSAFEADLLVVDATAPTITYTISATVNGVNTGNVQVSASAASAATSFVTVRMGSDYMPASGAGYAVVLTLTMTGASSSSNGHYFGEVRLNWR